MMDDRRGIGVRLRVGAFVLSAIAVFLVLIYLLGARARLFEAKYTLYADFTEVGGLVGGAGRGARGRGARPQARPRARSGGSRRGRATGRGRGGAGGGRAGRPGASGGRWGPGPRSTCSPMRRARARPRARVRGAGDAQE